MSQQAVILWEDVLDIFDGDEESMSSVIEDLFTESDMMFADIERGFHTNNFTLIKSCAHRVKGSAANLFCMELKHFSSLLHSSSDHALKCEPNKSDVEEMRYIFNQCKVSIQNIKIEVERRGHK